MGNIQRGHAGFLAQAPEQLQDLRRADHIECGSRLVEDQALRPAGERCGDQHTLFLATGSFVGKALHHCRRVLEVDVGEQLLTQRPGVPIAQVAMAGQHFHHLFAQAQGRVERRARVLEDHPQASAAQLLDLALRHLQQVFTVQNNAAAHVVSIAGQVAHDGEAQRSLARSGFADQTQHLAGADLKFDVLQDVERAARQLIVEAVVSHLQHSSHWRCPLGLRASRKPSPSRLKPIAMMAMARPGMSIIHGA